MILSIIVPVFNQWEFTELCFKSLLANPPKCPYQLIIVDNGSTDDTPQKLKEYADIMPADDYLVITNEENLGVSKAWNQGLKATNGSKVLIINNDIIFYPGTIDEMMAVDHWAVVPEHTSGDEDHHSHWQENIEGKEILPVATPLLLKGFCFLLDIKGLEKMYRSELKRDFSPANPYLMAMFDEQFEMAHYEDTDFDNRLRHAGHPPFVARRAFIHHFGSRTLLPNLGSLQPFINENAQKYRDKYNIKD